MTNGTEQICRNKSRANLYSMVYGYGVFKHITYIFMHTSSELDVLYTLIHTLTLTLTHKIYKTPTSIFVSTRQMKVLSTLNDRHFHSYDNHRLLIIMKFCISLFFSWCFRFLGLLVVSNGAKLWSSTLLPLSFHSLFLSLPLFCSFGFPNGGGFIRLMYYIFIARFIRISFGKFLIKCSISFGMILFALMR